MKAGYIILVCALFALITECAFADGAKRVIWTPSSSGSCEDCILVGHQMPNWDLKDTHYDGSNLNHASLYGADAERASFIGITGKHADFSRAKLSNAKFEDAKLSNATLTNISANGADFSEAVLDYSDVREARFVGANLTDISAIHILALDTDFSAADASGAVFDYATLRGAIFDGALLTGASFIESDLYGARFNDARLIDVNLARAINYQTADFTGACKSETTLMPPELVLPLCESKTVISTGATLVEAP